MTQNKPNYHLYVFFTLIALVIFHLSIHIPFIMTDSFGKVDAAKLANDCIKASYSGFHDLEYSINSCPFYYHVLTFLIRSHLISPPDIPSWMTFASLTSSAVVTLTLFILVFRLTSSFIAALSASLLLQVMPVFWQNSVYGFPTMVALAFLMISLVSFQSALNVQSGKRKYLLFVGAFVLYLLAIMTKLDTVLVSAIYCFLVWQSRNILKTRLIWIVCLTVIAGVAFLLTKQYAEFLNISQETAYNSDLTAFESNWRPSYRVLLSKSNLLIIAKSVGFLSIPISMIALAVIGWRKKWISTVIWLMLSALPLVLFWGIRPGNSARHNLIPALFLCILLALPFTLPNWRRWIWAMLLCGVVLINYFYFSPHVSQRSPSGNLVASTVLLKERMQYPHLAGKRIAILPHKKIAFIGNSHVQAFFRFELLSNKLFKYLSHTRPSRGVSTLEMLNGNQRRSYLWLYHNDNFKSEMSEIYSLIERGYFLVIANKKLKDELIGLQVLNGKWISLYQYEPILDTVRLGD